MYGAGCGPGDAQCAGYGGLWARWCTICGARRAVGQVVHNIQGAVGQVVRNVQGTAGCGPGGAQYVGHGGLWARWCTMCRAG